MEILDTALFQRATPALIFPLFIFLSQDKGIVSPNTPLNVVRQRSRPGSTLLQS